MNWFETGELWVKLFRAVQIVMVLGGIILVHEFGHFLAAKRSGMQVDEFAVGVGPTLFSWTRDGTRYRICLLLFMGYVKIAGLEGEERPADVPGSFYHRPIPQRLLVLAAGAIMNVLLALLIFSALFGFRGVPIPPDTVIEEVVAGSAAAEAGLAPGWRITEVSGQPTEEPGDVSEIIENSDGRAQTMTLTRDGESRTVSLTPQQVDEHWRIGVSFRPDQDLTAIVAKVDPGLPAHTAGLRPGDTIVALDGQPIRRPLQIISRFDQVPDKLQDQAAESVQLPPITVSVDREGQRLDFAVTPQVKRERRPVKGPDGVERVKPVLYGDVGLSLEQRFVRLGMAASVREGFSRSFGILGAVLENLGILLQGKQLDQVGGPVMIVKLLSQAAFLGWYELLNWAGILSIMIGVFNLLPLPALDGGRMVFVVLEPIWRWGARRFSKAEPAPGADPVERFRRFETWTHAVGLIMLLVLMLFVSYRDLLLG